MIRLKLAKIYLRKVAKIYRRLYGVCVWGGGGWGKFVPPPYKRLSPVLTIDTVYAPKTSKHVTALGKQNLRAAYSRTSYKMLNVS